MMSGQSTQSRVPPTSTDTGEKSDETISLAASNLFFQGNEIQKEVHPRSEKQDDIGLVLQAVHMVKTKHVGFSSQRNIMILWKMDLKYHHLRPQQQILGWRTINCR